MRRVQSAQGCASPLHVLHVIPTLSLGGTERHLVNLVRRSDPARLRHTVCVLTGPETLLPELDASSCETVTLRLAGKHPWIHAASAIYRLCQYYQPDVMHTWLYDAGISGRLGALALHDIPVVCGLQSAGYDPEVIRSQNWSQQRVRVLRLIDEATAFLSRTSFVGISQFVVDSALEHARFTSRRMLGVIPNAIDFRPDSSPQDQVRHNLGIQEDEFVVLNVGRLDSGKGQESLIRAFASAFETDTGVRLVILGDGPLRPHLTDLVRALEMTDRVLLPGVTADMGSVYRAADLFVFPSVHEGLGMALLEAMASGLPCIASDIPPLREVLEDGLCGVLVQPGDIASMAAALRRLHSDAPAREELARLATRRAADYTFERTLPMWEDAYRTMCRAASNRS